MATKLPPFDVAPQEDLPGPMDTGKEAIKQSPAARRNWWLNAPALVILGLFAAGPLLVMVVYSFLTAGDYGGVVWEFSTRGWFNVFLTEDIFTEEIRIQDAHLAIAWRSIKLSLLTTLTCLIFGFPTAYFIATRPPQNRSLWLFLIKIGRASCRERE